ncbi:MAG: hypothetical protein WCD35_19260 [Mycobacteriales bacterium]
MPRTFLAQGDLVVVETENDVFLGTAEVADGFLVIRSGYVGRPTLVALEDVEIIVPASTHPGVA